MAGSTADFVAGIQIFVFIMGFIAVAVAAGGTNYLNEPEGCKEINDIHYCLKNNVYEPNIWVKNESGNYTMVPIRLCENKRR